MNSFYNQYILSQHHFILNQESVQQTRLAVGARQQKHDLRRNRGRVQGRLPGRQWRTDDLLAFRSPHPVRDRELGHRVRTGKSAGGLHRRAWNNIVDRGKR